MSPFTIGVDSLIKKKKKNLKTKHFQSLGYSVGSQTAAGVIYLLYCLMMR